ncbi:phosphoribosylformylglycinamidine synthase subunit PurQ, partial [Kitasatospora sp. NPDC056808]
MTAGPTPAARSNTRVGVVTFPGSLDDRDTQRAIRLAGAEAV